LGSELGKITYENKHLFALVQLMLGEALKEAWFLSLMHQQQSF